MANSPQYAPSLAEDELTQGGIIERVEDEDELRERLMRDRYANAYLLGKLDPAYVPFCRWYGQRDEAGQLTDVLLWYQGLSIPVAFLVAGQDDPRAFFAACCQTLPSRFHFHIISDQMSAFRDACEVSSYKQMHRMGLERSVYKPVDQGGLLGRVERLGHRDTAAIMKLYAHYPDHFFEPSQLETGLCFGVRDPEGQLISIAGIHVVSPEHDVAVIGNLVTHPEARGQGLATACTRRLLDELFERVSFVALNVQTNNEPAIRMYANFGFETNNVFFEGRCEDQRGG